MTDEKANASVPLTMPLYLSAVYRLPDLDALDSIYHQEHPGFIYARDGHPNSGHLARQISQLHSASHGVVTGSGMGAISASILPFVKNGNRILASNRLYGKTTKLFRELDRFGVLMTFADFNNPDEILATMQVAPTPTILFVETISNPLCRVVDLPQLAKIAHEFQAKLIVDNTFATPMLCRPLEHGADIVMESLTKMIGGHSDLTLGSLSWNEPTLSQPITGAVSMYGLSANPFDCWLATRSLETFELRARVSTENAARVAAWLSQDPRVLNVAYPGLKSHPDFELAQTQLPKGCGHMLSFELQGGREAVNRFMTHASGIPFAPSLGHTSTTCSHPDTTSHRYDSSDDKLRQGITPGLIRLSVGCESIDTIIQELDRGLSTDSQRNAGTV